MSGPTTATIKALFARSGNRCAFPGCSQPLVDASSNKVTGRICHVKARSSGGPRYDPDQSEEERHGVDNLILMCPAHHDVIDADPVAYTVERLLEIKRGHEAQSESDLHLGAAAARQFAVNLEVGGDVSGQIAAGHDILQIGEIHAGVVNVTLPDRGPAPPSSGVSNSSFDEGSSFLNPFRDRGRINEPARFFDRQRILREMRQMLANGNSVSLVGDSEIGKSSLLYHLYQTATEWSPNARVCYVDLQGLLDEEDFCSEVLEGLGWEPGGLRALRRTLRRERVVLLLDEVEKLADPAFSSYLHHILRSVAQEPTLALAVASHRPLVEIFPPTDPTSPFHNVFTEKRLGPFSRDEARDFLAQRLQGTGMAFTPQELEQLMIESSGHPAQLQRLGYDLFERKRS